MSRVTDAIRAQWEHRRDELRRFGASVDGASFCEAVLADLDALDASESAVTLQIAAQHSGYSAGHLSRLIKLGKLPNYGRTHAPRVRVSECPKKRLVNIAEKAYDPDADARFLVSTRR